jgi:hypothetical protein
MPYMLKECVVITVKLGYSNIGFCDTLYIASNIINIVVLIIQRYSFITTLFLGPFDDVITKFYCIYYHNIQKQSEVLAACAKKIRPEITSRNRSIS